MDLSQSLVFLARKRGLEARVMDVEKQLIAGDLGILWGVVHHFQNPVSTLGKLHKSFNSLLIRAPVNSKRVCELGQKFDKKEFLEIVSSSGIERNECRIVESKRTDSLIIFVHPARLP